MASTASARCATPLSAQTAATSASNSANAASERSIWTQKGMGLNYWWIIDLKSMKLGP